MEWQFHPEAEAEFIESAAYYENEVPGLGRIMLKLASGGIFRIVAEGAGSIGRQ